MASMTHRISARFAWGCALVLAIGLSGCASSQDTGVSDPAGHVHFTVPGGWRPIGTSALAAELKSTTGGPGSAWTVAYEAARASRPLISVLQHRAALRLRRIRPAQRHREP